MTVTVHHGDSRDVLKTLADASIDSVVCDPPYALVSIGKRFGADNAAVAKSGKTGAYARASAGFMGQKWDTGETAFDPEFWAEVLRVLKPGGHLIAFSATRTYHRLACAIEDGGFEMRDMIAWLYGSGFPKSHDVSKGIDRHNGDERPVVGRETLSNDIRGGGLIDSAHGELRPAFERDITSAASAASAAWEGWGTALKPALEPCVLARKPLKGTVAANVLANGTGALNIAGTRIGTRTRSTGEVVGVNTAMSGANYGREPTGETTIGRWPANVIHDGGEDTETAFPEGSARFFYSAKADAADRCGSKHPTVKPTDLMAYLCRLVTQPGGLVLDPFAGSGSTGMACLREGFDCILIEREAQFVADIHARLAHVEGADTPLFANDPAPPPYPPPAGAANLRGLSGRAIGPIGMRR